MEFKNRVEAGKALADLLSSRFKNKNTVIYGLPRGGVVTAYEIAQKLKAPLDLIITRKIGHPIQREYAIAATTENGTLVQNSEAVGQIDPLWFKQEVLVQKEEAKRRRKKYLKGKRAISAKKRIAILVDDGVATGLTMKAAIEEVRKMKPKKIVVATPVIAKDIFADLKKQVDEIVALFIPNELNSIGAFYDEFPQVEDDEVIKLLGQIK